MLPVSGAEQLKASGAMGEDPMISQSAAYSRLVSPAPFSCSGKNRFHRPAARAFCFSSSITGGMDQRVGAAASCWWNTASAGYTWVETNARTSSSSAAARPDFSTFMRLLLYAAASVLQSP